MPTSLGPAEIIVILVVALIVLGPKRLPEAGRQVGRALAEVRRWSQGFQSEVRNVLDTEPRPETPSSVSAPPGLSITQPTSTSPETTTTEGSTPPATATPTAKSTPPTDPPTS